MFFFDVSTGHPFPLNVAAHQFIELSLTEEPQSTKWRNLILPSDLGHLFEPHRLILHTLELLFNVCFGKINLRFLTRSNTYR